MESALNDPIGFVKKKHATLMIIDEIQRVPELLMAIKKQVDENNQNGQYLLTGSADIQSLSGVKESLAGRISRIRLRPLSQGELKNHQPTFLEAAFQGEFDHKNEIFDKNDLIEFGFSGGYPEVIRLPAKDRKLWHLDYIQAILERDLKDIAHIKRHGIMHELVAVLAAWSGKYLNYEGIRRGLQIDRETLESYFNALEALYIIERIQPWINTDYERIGKHAKLFITDSGLMTSLLNWKKKDIELDADKMGKLTETYVFNQMAAHVDAFPGKYKLFHYRDREQREIDLLIENEDGALLGIEVKSGSTLKKDSFKTLKWFKQNIAKHREFIGIVVYTGEHVVSFKDNMWGVPFSCF